MPNDVLSNTSGYPIHMYGLPNSRTRVPNGNCNGIMDHYRRARPPPHRYDSQTGTLPNRWHSESGSSHIHHSGWKWTHRLCA